MNLSQEDLAQRVASLAAQGAYVGTSSWKYPFPALVRLRPGPSCAVNEAEPPGSRPSVGGEVWARSEFVDLFESVRWKARTHGDGTPCNRTILAGAVAKG